MTYSASSEQVPPLSTRLILATHNPHKLSELQAILASEIPRFDPSSVINAAGLGLPEPVENGRNFTENALIKARAVADATGLAAVADDSGLCVDEMNGMPGIFSARWSGSHGDDRANLRLLLEQLADVPAARRGAEFRCAAALVLPDGREFVEEGVLRGALRFDPMGEGGFGYDPIFSPTGYAITNAELSADEKNSISHRGLALRALVPHLVPLLV